ncbi:hypothetical protein XELAEV_18037674mg [Xenopus laevis]|uniref:Uncharacterized protein n=1 Tax=Xenopus laevis TaxID=8355 RepID=A0A974CCH8_XENLA|nr:hypothetical protein XELAEV_18037674mg [Xenopus laevis]
MKMIRNFRNLLNNPLRLSCTKSGLLSRPSFLLPQDITRDKSEMDCVRYVLTLCTILLYMAEMTIKIHLCVLIKC